MVTRVTDAVVICTPRTRLADTMQQIETFDPVEARRSRYAQYRGQVAQLKFGQSTVKGVVQSVREDNSSTPVRWLITVVSQ
jgi:hypothetical protein